MYILYECMNECLYCICFTTDLAALCHLFNRSELVSLMAASIPADQTHQLLVRLTEQLQLLLVLGTHQLWRFLPLGPSLRHHAGETLLQHHHAGETLLQRLLLQQLLSSSAHHVPQRAVGFNVFPDEGVSALWALTGATTGCQVSPDALPAKGVLTNVG